MTNERGPEEGWDYSPLPADMRLYDARTYTDLGTLDVDGETFAIRWSDDGAHHYDWISGPNPGYGFTVGGGSSPRSRERHVAEIRDFLAAVDPATGYL